MRNTPSRARGLLSTGLREARWLHSRERRLVGDGIRGVLQDQAMLDARSGLTECTDQHRWIGWLVEHGLELDVASTEAAEIAWSSRASAEEVLGGLDPVARVATAGSLDPWIAAEVVSSLKDEADAFVQACRQRAAVDLRVQGVKRERVRSSLGQDGIQTEPVSGVPTALRVQGRANLQATQAWRSGWFEVQDAGSQLLASLVDPDGGPIVDLCAGAGGKTLALAAASPDSRILATDVRARALNELRKRARRAGKRAVQTCVLPPDGALPDQVLAWRGASRVLVDAPCSGTGTLRRHPELRLRLDRRAVDTTRRLQREILQRAATLVAEGGRLIYATCSVLDAENRAIVADFLADNPDFETLPADGIVPARFCEGPHLRTLPHRHDMDGFFGAVLVRHA